MTDFHTFGIEQARHSGSPQYSFVAEDEERQDALEISPAHSNTNFSTGDRYRSLVHESPPANFGAKTPQDELRTGSNHNTPSPFRRGTVPSPMSDDKKRHSSSSNSTPNTREFRTESEWDELMRLKGIIPSESIEEKAATPEHKSVSPARREQKHQHASTIAKKQLATTTATTTTTTLSSEPKADIPSYMRATASYESRLHRSQRDPTAHSRLKKSTHKQRPMQIPRFQSSTRINAMDDIHNEMRDEDVYIPLAVRIKLFEQNLRGGDRLAQNKATNSQAKPTDTHHTSTSSSLTRPRSPKLLTRQRSHPSNLRSSSQSQSQSSQEKRPPLSTEQTNSGSDRHRTLSRISRPRTTGVSRNKRISSATRPGNSKASNVPSSESSELPKNVTKKQKTSHHTTTVKPFRFATDERAVHHQKAFKAKLSLWKEKEKEILDEATRTVGAVSPQRHRGTKRKVQED